MGKFLFILGTDNNEKATRCFQLAKIAHKKGHEVNLFLIDDGVLLANRRNDLHQKTVTGDCLSDYLPHLVENQIPIGV